MGIIKTVFYFIAFTGINCQAQDLVWMNLGVGQKPKMALQANEPSISYFKEDATIGFVSLAKFNNVTKVFDHEKMLDGNFYGPAYIDVYDDELFFVFHNHDLNGGGASVVFSDGVNWIEEDGSNLGHDGWDSDIKVFGNDEIYVSYIDAIPFSGLGLEFSSFNGIQWEVDTVGTTTMDYGFGTSLEMMDNGAPSVLYYNSTTDALEKATKNNSVWDVIQLDTIGSPGFFPVTCKEVDTIYVAYYNRIGGRSAELKIGKLTPNDQWETHVLDTLIDVNFSLKGRCPIEILKTQSNLRIVASDEKVIKQYEVSYALQFENEVDIFKVMNTDTVLMQTVSYEVDNQSYDHYSFSYVKNNTEHIYYGTNRPGIGFDELQSNQQLSIYPNPVESSFSINVDGVVFIYDSKGGLVKVADAVKDGWVDVSEMSAGYYFLKFKEEHLSFIIK